MINETELRDANIISFEKAVIKLNKIKYDTKESSTFSYLRDYKKQPKNKDGLYEFKAFPNIDDLYFEKMENAQKHLNKLSAASKAQQGQKAQQDGPAAGV